MKVFEGFILSLLLSFISFVSASTIESVNVNENQKLVGIIDYEQMGCSVAIDGNTMVVSTSTSMTGEAARVYVYERANSESTFGSPKILTPSDNNDNFGSSVDISGDTIVVGASDGPWGGTGSAYVYEKPSAGWVSMTQTAKLTASDGDDGDCFGTSVAIDNETIVIGAVQSDIPETSTGSAYIFTKPTESWVDASETAKLTAFDGDIVDFFGSSVAIDGDNVLIGAKGANHEDGNVRKDGAAYLFKKPNNGWSSTSVSTKIEPDVIREGAWFGSSVAIDGSTIAIGSDGDEQYSYNGALYIFEENPTTKVFQQKAILTASDEEYNDDFAEAEKSIAIDNDVVIVGARSKRDSEDQLTFSVSYLFKKPSTGWENSVENTKIIPSDAVIGDSFGHSVAIDNNTIVIGASTKDKYESMYDGATYIFNIDNNGLTSSLNPAIIMYLLN